ncbi:MAG: UDP-N-acetylmuramoyl-L-alanyl-D-glutamate--2,6-diaminopimelate ligase [Candidatus Dojkabacteria bacterium]|nr:UDP-N-acetylmuramoyl-L-alanyl-D-glutamate--2,6-diaminopimelate ligase [Candidatus Dojkabacteria bacterium]
MSKYDIDSVSVVGIGGTGAYYIAKFFLLLGKDVYGYDLKETDRTKELEEMGARIEYSNPTRPFETDCYLYTHNMPENLIDRILSSNKNIPGYEIGEFYHSLISDYEDNLMSEIEKDAFIKSELAPLYSLDLENVRMIGVTGTDGKTTSCTMIYHLLKSYGYKPALISTVSAIIGDEEIDTGFHTTTPTSQELYKLIKKALGIGCTHIVLETTSHGLEQGRVAGIKFDGIGYTNVTNEHLDYHKTYEKYLEAKSLLITNHTKSNSIIVLNKDDASYEFLSNLSMGKDMSYSIKDKQADLYASNIQDSDNLKFKLNSEKESLKVEIPIYGKYNVSNFLLACGICINEGLTLENICDYIKGFVTVKGRMELLQSEPFKVFVDFAHTPNATFQVLNSLRDITKGRIIHVFGCAGLRDKTKRYSMGKISNELADISILTAEDPRTEDLKDINNEIERGWKDGGFTKKEIIRFDNDKDNIEVRKDAIKKALELAEEGDIVIITGKAHEQSLCFGDIEYSWNDIAETEKLLSSLHKS